MKLRDVVPNLIVADIDRSTALLAARPIGGTATLFVTVEAESVDAGIDALFGGINGRARVVMPLKDQFYGMREFAITDPDGYVLIFAQRVG